MKKLFLGLTLTFGLALNAHSQVTSSVGVTYLPDYRGVDVGAAFGSIGYRIDMNSKWSCQPELRAGIGVIDDSVRGFSPVQPGPMVDVELDNLLGAAGRFQYQSDGGTYLFVQPNLTRVKLNGGNNLATRGLSESDRELGGDVGAGFLFGEGFGVEASYGVLDGEPVATAALRLYL